MTLETFFEKFDELADAPNAVGKMRELILDLAIGNKLLDSPRDRVSSKSVAWPKQSLGSIASLITKGATPTSYGHQYEPSGIPFIKVENINDGSIQHSSIVQFISAATHEFLKRSKLESGDVLFSIAGTIGKTCIVNAKDVPANTNQALAIIRGVAASFDTSFLKMQLDSFVSNKIKARARGGAMPNVSLGDIRELVVVVPPLAEQKRIVAKVDELMALCDRLEAQQQERVTRHAALARASLATFADAPTPANLNLIFHKSYTIPPADLRKSILTLAVQGKLVPQDPQDEPAEVPSTAKRLRRFEPIAEKEIPFELPRSWRWSRLGSEAEFINGDRGKNYPNKNEYVPTGVPFINTGHIQPGGTLSLTSMHYLTRAKYDSLRNGKVQKDDLVYCLRGATLGKTAIIDQFIEGAVASSLVIIRLGCNLTPRYTYYYLISPLGRELITRFDNGSAQPNLSANSVTRYVAPVPPLAEQRRIVAKVDQLMALVDQLEAQLAASRATAEKLMEAVVAELTSGAGAN